MAVTKLIEKLHKALIDQSWSEISYWKNENPDGKVVGYFPEYSAAELIHAAGMLPVLITGAGGRFKIHQANRTIQAFICDIGRGMPELLRLGYLDNLDAMVFPAICEVSRALCWILSRHAPHKPFFYFNVPQNLDSRYTEDYLINELLRLKAMLEQLGGKPITDEALRESFRVYNHRTEILNSLDMLRKTNPECLSGTDFYILKKAGSLMSVEEHINLLEEALEQAKSQPVHPKPALRMILVGAFCEQPPIAFIQALEQAGVTIVGDDLLLSQQWWSEPLPIDDNPLQMLARHYIRYSPLTSVIHRKDPYANCRAVIDSVEKGNADGVIIATAKFCHPAQGDIGCIVSECEKSGILYFRLEFQEDMNAFEPVKLYIDALLEARAQLPIAGTENGRVKH